MKFEKKKVKRANSHLQGAAEAPGKARRAPPLVVKAESAAARPCFWDRVSQCILGRAFLHPQPSAPLTPGKCSPAAVEADPLT